MMDPKDRRVCPECDDVSRRAEPPTARLEIGRIAETGQGGGAERGLRAQP